MARLLNLLTRRTVLDKHYLVHIPYWYSARRWILEILNRLSVHGASSPDRLPGPDNMYYVFARCAESDVKLT
ncbi:MAG: hypothetical protein U5R46_04400 [Gammaproteobacteria bacterium]|nr:hypothetical protein [Gammaproteobacteria bacterium]